MPAVTLLELAVPAAPPAAVLGARQLHAVHAPAEQL
jgi:hypothetical protein